MMWIRAFVVLVLAGSADRGLAAEIEGLLVDQRGRGVANAQVSFPESVVLPVITDVSGRFRISEVTAPVRVVITRDGATLLDGQVWRLDRIVIDAFADEVTVTATGRAAPLLETAASVTVLSSATLRESPGLTLDDKLRQVPGFTLFRRSGSRVANPTSQGVSLRGVGPSGASRALVLDDDVPLNDPFGGWVHWGRIAEPVIAQVEIMRGGGSDLYGSGAVGGVINLVRSHDPAPWILQAYGGSQETAGALIQGSLGRDRWRAAAFAEIFDTGGFVPVISSERGGADVPATAQHVTAEITLRALPDEQRGAFVRAHHYEEERDNGTRLQENATDLSQFVGGLNAALTHWSLTARAHSTREDYEQTFSAVSSDRSSETLTRAQRVPAAEHGLSVRTIFPFNADIALVSGLQARRVDATNKETVFTAMSTATTATSARQDLTALYGELLFTYDRVAMTAGVRQDRWENTDAVRRTATASQHLPDRSSSRLSPRVSAQVRITSYLRINAAAYRAFRAPTLNELYRSFRVGNIVTLANEHLEAELLEGLDAGVLLPLPADTSVRLTLFDMKLRDAISNVTISEAPGVITRQRQNVGQTRSRGIEIDVSAQLPHADFSLGYAWLDAVVREFDPAPSLVGRQLPQVPGQQATAQLSRRASRFSGTLQGRYSSSQYEDDLNQVVLDSYTTLDAFASWQITPRASLFLAGENVTDTEIESGRNPVTTHAVVRSFRAGVRVSQW